MKTLYSRLAILVVLTILCLSHVMAQTPGMITKPATNGGQAILDPNGDGYVSKTSAGFLTKNDEGAAYSEIPYRFFPAMSNEVLGDLNTGTIGGHTDFAPSESDINTGSPAATYFDGKNFMYRMRLGGQSSASKGYSVLIDTDGQFPGGAPNPGFEYEVVLASNFGVQIIKHSPTGQQIIFNGSTEQYSQKSVAASRAGGDIDYFYDFYVPLSAFQGGITASTPLRMSAVTISSAQSGLSGTISDVAGLNFREYGFDPFKAWLDIITAFPPTSLNDMQTGDFQKLTAVPPVVNDPIYTTSTNITGTSIEAPGSVIEVYRTRVVNGTQVTVKIGETVVKTDGTWVLSGVAIGSLLVNDVITATVTPSNKYTSGPSNKVVVLEGSCFSVVPPIITGIYNPSGTGLKGISGTSTYNGPQTINIYHSSNTKQVYYSIQFTPAPGATFPYTWNLLFDSNDKTLTSGLYTATITPQGGCESEPSNQICYKSGNSGTLNDYKPTITQVTLKDNTVISTGAATAYVPAQIKTISGTLPAYVAGITIEVLVDGVIQSNVTVAQSVSSSSPYSWSMNLSNLILTSGDVVTVRSKIASNDCVAILSSASNFLVITPVTAAPVINAGPYCGIVSYISGTSTELAGTVIEIYANGVATGKKSNVTLSGKWGVDLSSLPGGGISPGVQITARALAVEKLLSPVSNAVVSSPVPTGNVTINPVTEGQTTISGSAPASSGSTMIYVTVTVDGKAYPEVLTDMYGNWKVTGVEAFDVYPGATITASYRTSGFTCPSVPVSTTAQCKKPLKYNSGTRSVSICSGETVQITLPYSEPDVFYVIMNGSTQTGSSVMGTGGAIVLTTGPLYTSTTLLTVMATKTGSGCSETMGGSTNVTVNPLPAVSGLAFNPAGITSSCPGIFTATLTGTNSAYTYQLIDQDGNVVGVPVQGITGGSISLSTGYLSATRSFHVRITDLATNCGVTATSPVFTVTINGPVLTPSVTPAYQTVCMGSTAAVVVSSTQAGYVYQLMRSSDHVAVSAPVNGTGAQISIVSYPFVSAGTENYYVAVRAISGSCANDFRLLEEVTIEVIADATSTASSSWSLLCGENISVTLQGNTPPAGGSGFWALSSTQHTTGDNVVIADPASATTTVSGLSSGTYTFSWTVTSSCGSRTTTSTSSVTVTVNCPGYYEVTQPKYVEQYRLGEVVAVAKDPDNGVSSATLVAGQMLPPGTVMNPNTGVISVSNPSILVPGTYTFLVDLVDGNGFTTTVPVTLRFLGIGPAPGILPVDLLYFTAKFYNGKPLIEWGTATVAGNVRFVIERSSDGKSFTKIGSLLEGRESNQAARYSFPDNNPLYGTAYYRLYQIDTEGQESISKIISLNGAGGATSDASLKAYPNPFASKLNASFTATAAGDVVVQILNLQGSLMHKQVVKVTAGVNEIELPLQSLSEGVYILKATGAGVNEAVKVMKTR